MENEMELNDLVETAKSNIEKLEMENKVIESVVGLLKRSEEVFGDENPDKFKEITLKRALEIS